MALRKPDVAAETTQAHDPSVVAEQGQVVEQATAVQETQVEQTAAVVEQATVVVEKAADPVAVTVEATVVVEKVAAAETVAEASAAAEPVAEQPAAAAPEAATQQVVMREEAAAPAVVGVTQKRESMAVAFKAELAEQGFEDIELTGRSFDRVILHEGQFKLGNEKVEMGKELNCIVHSTRAVYVVRQSDDDDAKVYYSYDEKGEFLADGSSAEEIRAEWREDGYDTEDQPVDIKKYLEVMITIVDRPEGDPYNGHMASLSIPPASRDRLAGAFAMAKQKFKSLPDGVVTQCLVGAEAKSGNGKPFRPWVFKALRKLTEADLA